MLIFYWLYVKLFEKKVNKIKEEKAKIEQIRIQNIIKKPTARDYDKEPIVVENRYERKSDLTIIFFMFLLFFYLIINSLEPQVDTFDNHIRRAALTTGTIGILILIYKIIILTKSIKYKIWIKIYQKHLEYEYINDIAKKEYIRIDFNEDLKVGYSFIPIVRLKNNKKNGKITFNDRYEKILFYPLRLIINFVFSLVFYLLNLYKINKYYVFKSDKFIVSVLASDELKNRFGKVQFEILTLTNSLVYIKKD
ncbi:hypothetical protein [Campylobacter portucalensis]|uniref:hypothetical protein n=1 Tax=Campylobacter portucalensis TaxID=2608384 RepID=UPI001E37F1D4|nr:hypothetical protein [Campylobacter portucalensis]